MSRDPTLLVLVLCAAACDGTAPAKSAGASPTATPTTTTTAPVAISQKANVRFKRNERLRNDLMEALDLHADQVCKELGKDSCTDVVHTVALGGVDPYGAGLYEPLPFTTTTAPMAIDRVVLSACVARVELDLGDPGSAVVFQALDVDADGALVDPASSSVDEAIDALYRRGVQRAAEASEIAHLEELYEAVLARGGDAPARDWAVVACFSVLTTLEFLFY